MTARMFRGIVAAMLILPAAGALAVSIAQEKSSSGESGIFKNLKYRLIGLAAEGRGSRSAGVAGNPLVYFAGTASGGIWKSSDGGYRWKPDPQAARLIDASKELNKKLDGLEARLHNPKAEISYDIMAQPGGAMLHSKLSSLLSTVQASDTRLTQGMTGMYGECRQDLDALTKDFQALVAGPVADINQMAGDLKLPHILLQEMPAKR